MQRRYRLLGADPAQIAVSGNMKFDMPIPDGRWNGWRRHARAMGALRPVWMAASTHEGEELAVLEAHLEVLKRLPDALLLIAPRHPERFRAGRASRAQPWFRCGDAQHRWRAGASTPGLRDRCDGAN